MFEKFDWILGRYQELSEAVSQPEILADQALWQKLLKEHAAMEPSVRAYEAYQKTISQLQEIKELLAELSRTYPSLKDRMLHALQNDKQYGLWNKE